ncbi:hypothetical protein R1sor_018554 [Riccia sorocarpa]|uniref:Replitron HUH endonuclease domain-containing protein n=1 Tax=Riccia sorocarpa TaxID=122646 RepID=A0ABD3IA34_9MARC
MERATYYLRPPWPEQVSLNQLVCIKSLPIAVQQNGIQSEKGGAGSSAADWGSALHDYYKIADYSIIERLERGLVVACGPFRVVESTENFVILEDQQKNRFSHPKWLERQIKGKPAYRSTAKSLWTDQCACEQSAVEDSLPTGCLCNQKKKLKRTRRGAVKELEISLTVGQTGRDLEDSVFDKLAIFLEKEASMALIALERGDSQLQLHIQAIVAVKTSSLKAFKTDVAAALDWDERWPPCGTICAKSVKNNGLHTFTGLVGYCLKDEHEIHFRVWSKNVTEIQKEQGRKMHIIYGSSVYKNRVEITPSNILGRALQYRKYNARHPLTVSFRGCLRQMMNPGQYLASLRWILSPPMSIPRAETVWKIATNPSMVDVLDIEEVFFDAWQKGRYFNETNPERAREGGKSETSDDEKRAKKRKNQKQQVHESAKSNERHESAKSNEGETSSAFDKADAEKRMKEDLDILLAYTKSVKNRENGEASESRIPVHLATEHCKRTVEQRTPRVQVRSNRLPGPEYISLIDF